MKKILLLGSQHGDELLGEKLFEYIQSSKKDIEPFVEFRIANEQAHSKKVRYIESDMNRAYIAIPQTYEEYQAEILLRYIRHEAFDLVLDLHTTRCQQPPCFIVGTTSREVNRFIGASSIKYVAHMTHSIVKTSLIGVCDQALSIEVQDDEVSDDLFEAICSDIERYIYNKKSGVRKYHFAITDLLYKNELSEIDVTALVNFKKSDFGFYPILVGENSYKNQTNFLGFKAQRITSVKEGVGYNGSNE